MSIHLQLLEPESATKIATLVNILKKLVRVFTILGTATKNLGSVLLFSNLKCRFETAYWDILTNVFKRQLLSDVLKIKKSCAKKSSPLGTVLPL